MDKNDWKLFIEQKKQQEQSDKINKQIKKKQNHLELINSLEYIEAQRKKERERKRIE